MGHIEVIGDLTRKAKKEINGGISRNLKKKFYIIKEARSSIYTNTDDIYMEKIAT